MSKIQRNYGKDRGSFGDIIHSKSSSEFFSKLNLRAVGQIELTLKRREDGCYDIRKVYYKDSERKSFSLGKTFLVKNKNKNVVEGLTQFGLSLFSEYDSTQEKDVMSNADCLILTTHKLKEQKSINDDLTKVGYITGKFAIEKPDSNADAGSSNAEDNNEIPF